MALTPRAVDGLALRQTEEPQAGTLEVALPLPGAARVHLLADSIGLKLCGSGDWLLEKHGTRTRRSWRKLHIGVDADTGRILAAVILSRGLSEPAQPTVSLTAPTSYASSCGRCAVRSNVEECLDSCPIDPIIGGGWDSSSQCSSAPAVIPVSHHCAVFLRGSSHQSVRRRALASLLMDDAPRAMFYSIKAKEQLLDVVVA